MKLKLRVKRKRAKQLSCRLQEPVYTSAAPVLEYSAAQRQVKGEDVLFTLDDLACAYPDRPGLGKWSLYCVCDGHGGTRAAKFVKSHLAATLSELLPLGKPPPFDKPEGAQFAESVQAALVNAFLSLSEAFAADDGRSAGTTVSVALMCGWMLTIANVGDSEVFLDKRTQILEMTCCHKVNNNREEQERLKAAGMMIKPLSKSRRSGPPMEGEAGVGPLRAWPGGIAMSRSLGDIDCGPHILPMPHIRQVIVPPSGARMVLASDGLWDHISGEKACKMIRHLRLGQTAHALMQNALESSGGRRLSDDTSVLVLDILPVHQDDFTAFTKQKVFQKRVVSSFTKLLQRAVGKKPQYALRSSSHLYADVDGMVEYANLLDRRVRDKIKPASNVRKPSFGRGDSQRTQSQNQIASSISGSDAWDMCQASWQAQLCVPTVWEFDERNILDSAQNFTSSGSHSSSKGGPDLSVFFSRPVGKNASCKPGPPLETYLDTSSSVVKSGSWEGPTLVSS